MVATETQAAKVLPVSDQQAVDPVRPFLRAMRQAQDAWQDAREAHAANPTPESKAHLTATARLTEKAEGEWRLAKNGRFRRSIPAGNVECSRCGGFGGHSQWPGFVCFECNGVGSAPA